jgi:hypothetical protein
MSVDKVEIRDLTPGGIQIEKIDVNVPPPAGWQRPSDTRFRWIHIPMNDTEVVTVSYVSIDPLLFVCARRLICAGYQKWIRCLVDDTAAEALESRCKQGVRPPSCIRTETVPGHALFMEPSFQVHDWSEPEEGTPTKLPSSCSLYVSVPSVGDLYSRT